jgi:hypothetical protein
MKKGYPTGCKSSEEKINGLIGKISFWIVKG